MLKLEHARRVRLLDEHRAVPLLAHDGACARLDKDDIEGGLGVEYRHAHIALRLPRRELDRALGARLTAARLADRAIAHGARQFEAATPIDVHIYPALAWRQREHALTELKGRRPAGLELRDQGFPLPDG